MSMYGTTKLKVGDRVKTTSKGKYTGLTVNLFGTVELTYSNSSIGVRLDTYRNPRSDRGLYYFNEAQLVRVGKDSETMEGNYFIAKVHFIDDADDARVYNYACFDDSILIDDICVVKTAHHGFSLARVVTFLEKDKEAVGAGREIVCKVDFSAYEARVETRKRREQLKADMQLKAAQMQELAVYQMLADKDPEMAAMLEEYKRLTDGLDKN